jgi:hypothetical protein
MKKLEIHFVQIGILGQMLFEIKRLSKELGRVI